VCAKVRCAPLRIKKALGAFRELITTRTTRVAFGDSPSGTKNQYEGINCSIYLIAGVGRLSVLYVCVYVCENLYSSRTIDR